MDGEASAREPDGLDAAAAALAANGSDLDLLVHRLAEKLAAVPGLDPVVTYRQPRWRRLLGDLPSVNDLHRRSHPIARLAVRVGTSDDVLETTRSSLSCRVDGRSASGGRTSQGVAFARWIGELTAAVRARRQAAQESLVALEDLIVYDRPN